MVILVRSSPIILLYVLGTCGYTIVQFFCYTGATHKKTATQLYAKKWLIYGSYTLQPKKTWANYGLAVKSPSAPRRRDGPHSLRKVQTAHTLVFTNWRSEPFLGSRPRPIQKLNDRQAVVEFLVGTQGLEPWTQ